MARFITPVARTTAPRALCALAYDPVDRSTGGSAYSTTAGRWSLAVATREGHRWEYRDPITVEAEESASLWRELAELGEERKRCYMVARCASDALTLLGLWDRVDAGLLALRTARVEYTDRDGTRRKRRALPLVLSGVPDVIGWQDGPAEWRAVSAGNHLGGDLVSAAESVGHPAPKPIHMIGRPSGHHDAPCDWTATALIAVYARLISWWVENHCGRWCDTIGAAAYQLWRTTLGDKEILQHDHPQAVGGEVAAVHGGRVQLFWFGSAGQGEPGTGIVDRMEPAIDRHIPGPAWKLDVRSMYAHLLSEERFPVRLCHELSHPTPKSVAIACQSALVVATCRVRVAEPWLPYTDPTAGVVYPAGEWNATLTTPEYLRAFRRGEIVSVGRTYLYAAGRPFRGFARWLIEQRDGAREVGEKLIERWCKSLANALGGRLARTFRGWSHVPGRIPVQRWGEWCEDGEEVGTVARWRGVAGECQQWVSKDERQGGLTACFAHLTAYGRCLLADLIDTAGAGNTLWCDTDGMIVTDAGLRALYSAGKVGSGEAGRLRLEGPLQYFAGRTPKHYQAGDKWILSGVRGDCSPVYHGAVRSYQTVNPVRAGEKPGASGIPTVAPTIHLDRIPLSTRPGADGWGRSPVVVGGALVWPADALAVAEQEALS